LGTAGFPWTPVLTRWLVPLQFAVLLGAYIFSADFGYRLTPQTYADRKAAARGFVPLLVFLTLVVLFFGWLYGG